MTHLLSKLSSGNLYKHMGHLCVPGDVVLRPVESLACQFGGYVNGTCNNGFVYNSGLGGSYSGNYQAASQLRNAIANSEGSTTYTWQHGNYEPKFAMICGSLGMGLGGGVDPVRTDGSWAMYPAKRFALPSQMDLSQFSRVSVIIKGFSNYFRACNDCTYGNAYSFGDWVNNNSVSGFYVWSSGGDGWRRQTLCVHTYGAVGDYYPNMSHYCTWREWVYGDYTEEVNGKTYDRRGYHWEYHTEDIESYLGGGATLDEDCNPTLKAWAFLDANSNVYHDRALARGGVCEHFQTFNGGYDYYPYISGSSWYGQSDGVPLYRYDLGNEDLQRLQNGNLWVSVTPCNSLSSLFVSGNNIPGSGGQQIVAIDDYKLILAK